MEQSDDRELRAIILDRIRSKGRITFAEFMDACLYEPGLGYYTSPGRKVGGEGDFYTSINVHRIFGRLIAREIIRMWEAMDAPADFSIVEAGGGNGRLALDILETIAELRPPLYETLSYRIVEAEPSLRDAQAEMLAGHSGKWGWNDPVDLKSGRLSFSGCLLSNELIDSFPVHLVEMTAEGLREVFVAAKGDRFTELVDIPSTPELDERMARLGIVLCPGQRAEISLASVRWLADVARALERGFVMTIDYGYPAQELYAPFRKNGTLLCYFRHRVEEDPYARVGMQDITSHVDFTTLIDRGEELGLAKVWFGEQYRFLMGAGLMEEMTALEAGSASEEEKRKARLIVKKLILPDGGMGDTFKVLIQARGVKSPGLLCMEDWSKRL